MKPTKIAFEKRYSDDSGVEFGVRYDENRTTFEVVFESCGEVYFPADKIDWLIESLVAIREIIKEQP